MKKFILTLFLSYCSIVLCDEPKNNFHIIPDVMNKVLIQDNDRYNHRGRVYDADTLPVFSGFPKVVSGQSTEGGIYCQMDSDSEYEIVYGIGTTTSGMEY